MKVKVSWFQGILTALQTVTTLVSFLIAAAEVIYEGVGKAGEEKKKWVLSQWEPIRTQVRELLVSLFDGDHVVKVWDFISDPRIVSIVIDILVLVFNLKGLFPKG